MPVKKPRVIWVVFDKDNGSFYGASKTRWLAEQECYSHREKLHHLKVVKFTEVVEKRGTK